MRELIEITTAFESLCRVGKPAALATVVRIEGSSYRRPGARMLMAEDGRTWGGVSGGCLERDVFRRALGAIATGRACLAKYDTTDDEQLAGAVATGCGGTVEILIQPLSQHRPGPMLCLAEVLQSRKPLEVVTVVRAAGELAGFAGSTADLSQLNRGDCDWPVELRAAAIAALTGHVTNQRNSTPARARSSESMFFTETVSPPQQLTVFGAGPDVASVVSIAKTLGWRVTVVGASPAAHLAERFRSADVLHVTGSDDPTAGVEIRPESAVLVMTHNVSRDAKILLVLPRRLRYLGVLGPRHRTEKILSELPIVQPGPNFYSPVGLDLGAETPEEIALSIVAEIQKALRSAGGDSLRDGLGMIHNRSERMAAAQLLLGDPGRNPDRSASSVFNEPPRAEMNSARDRLYKSVDHESTVKTPALRQIVTCPL